MTQIVWDPFQLIGKGLLGGLEMYYTKRIILIKLHTCFVWKYYSK